MPEIIATHLENLQRQTVVTTLLQTQQRFK